MAKKMYWSIIILFVWFVFISVYIYTQQYPSIIFWEDINAYNFWWSVQLESMFVWFILLYPFLVFPLIHLSFKNELNYLRTIKEVAWIFPALLMLILLVGFLFYGFDNTFLPDDGTRWSVQEFPYRGENYPFIYVISSILLIGILNTLFIDIYLLSRIVVKTLWLQIVLYISLYVFFGVIVGLFINEVILTKVNFTAELFWIAPNYDAPLHTYLIYYVVLKILFIGIILYGRKRGWINIVFGSQLLNDE